MSRRAGGQRLARMVLLGMVAMAASMGAAASGSGLRPGTWTMIPPPQVLRMGSHSATLLKDGRVLIAGGNYPVSYTATAEIFNPVTNTWTPTGSMTEGRSFHTATLLADGSVLVTGGYGNPAATVSVFASAERYDPAPGTWRRAGTMHDPRSSHTATLLPNGKVLVAGGVATGHGQLITAGDVFDPASSAWTPTPAMPQGRAEHTATLMRDGNVLVAAGRGPAHDPSLRDVLVYNTASGNWSTVPQLLEDGRGLDTANLLPDGKVMLIGGLNRYTGLFSANLLASTDIYDPATGSIALGPPMKEGRFYHTSTLLPDGRILVAGGFGRDPSYPASASQPLASTELYSAPAGTWSAGTPMPRPMGEKNRAMPITATLLDQAPCGSDCGKVLFVGGNIAMLYDPAKGQAVEVTPAPGAALRWLRAGNRLETIGIGAGAVILLAGIGIVLIRRRRA